MDEADEFIKKAKRKEYQDILKSALTYLEKHKI